MAEQKLTEKQKRFVDEYMIDLNATQAAIRAGYSKRTADVQCIRLLGNVRVQEYLQKQQLKAQKKTEITKERVLKELAAVAFAKATDYVQVVKVPFVSPLTGNKVIDPETGEPMLINDVDIITTDKLTPDMIAAVAGIKMGRNGIEVKLNDKLKALDQLSRVLGLYSDNDSGTNAEAEVSSLYAALERDDNDAD